MYQWYLVLVLILAYCYWWWSRRSLWIHTEKFPGPRWLPFLGNVHKLPTDNLTIFKTVNNLFDEYGGVFRLWLGPVNVIFFLKDPEVIRQVLSHSKVMDRDVIMTHSIGTIMPNGLVALNGAEWKRHRKLMAPAFHKQLLQEYVKIFAEKGRQLRKKLSDMADERSINIYKYLGMVAVDAVSSTVIGADGNSLDNDDTSIVDSVYHVNEIVVARIIAPWLLIDRLFYMTSMGAACKKMVKMVQTLSENVIQQKLELLRRGVKRAGIITASDKKINSFLDMMIETAESEGTILTAEELRDEVITILMTGTDSTALTLSYLLTLIAIHPDVQKQIHKELDFIYGDDKERHVTADDVNEMPVLDRVIKETIRLFPIVPMSARLIPNDILLKNGKTLPKGSTVIVFPYAIHRDEANFKDANRFWPDRWLPENIPADRHSYAYLPFSSGKRVCIGKHYAMLQMKTTLSELLRVYSVTTMMTEKDLTDNLLFGLSLQLSKSLGGVQITIHKREFAF